MRTLSEFHGQKLYLVEYHFKNPHDPQRYRFYTKLRKLVGKPISRYTYQRSTFAVNDEELAKKIEKLVLEHGGTCKIRQVL